MWYDLPMTIPSEALRECKTCGEVKPASEYYLHSSKKYLLRSCKTCVIKKSRDRRTGPDRDRVLAMENESSRKKRIEIRDKVFAAYGGYKCVCCGETEPTFLTLDHINNDGGEFRRKELGRRTMAGYHTYRWLIRNGYPDTVQVMCMNCQHGKLMNDGICPHSKNV